MPKHLKEFIIVELNKGVYSESVLYSYFTRSGLQDRVKRIYDE
jgi:hypothetical protein